MHSSFEKYSHLKKKPQKLWFSNIIFLLFSKLYIVIYCFTTNNLKIRTSNKSLTNDYIKNKYLLLIFVFLKKNTVESKSTLCIICLNTFHFEHVNQSFISLQLQDLQIYFM